MDAYRTYDNTFNIIWANSQSSGYYISFFADFLQIYTKELNNINGEQQLANVFLKRGEVYAQIKEIELMCEDYKKACDLGNCEMFNENCK